MADQGLPLMAIPQTNLFGQAGDDLAGVLAQRELKRRNDLIQELTLNSTLNKNAGDTAKANAEANKANAEAGAVGPKSAADLAETQARTSGLNATTAKTNQDIADHNALGPAMDAWHEALTSGDLNKQMETGTRVYQLGGKIMPPEMVKELGAKDAEQATGMLMDQYETAFKAKDTPGMLHAGLALMQKGIKVPGMDASPYASNGPGGVYNTMTGDQIHAPQALTPPGGTDNPVAAFKNYQVVKGEIDKARTQYTANLPRMERLEATIAQHTPQADAIVAPELITVMAGGMGSGVRINQAEIDNTIGGRNGWQDLQAKVQKWQANPNQPFLITPAQRQQMLQLIGVVKAKTASHLADIQKADQDLINSTSVADQRNIFINLQKSLEGDATGQPQGAPPPANPQVGDQWQSPTGPTHWDGTKWRGGV